MTHIHDEINADGNIHGASRRPTNVKVFVQYADASDHKITIESHIRVCDFCRREFVWERIKGDHVPIFVNCQDTSCNGWAKEKK